MAATTSQLVSVIVPVYNVEKYIDDCLRSIVKQTYKNIEILLIDDATPDKSGEKCDQWAKKDERIKVVHKSKNEGLFQARITGFEKMTGDYFVTVDSDDLIAPDFVEKFLDKAMSADADIVVSDSFIRLHNDGSKENAQFPHLYAQSGVLSSLLKNIVKSDEKFGWNVWGKMYDAKVYTKARKYLTPISAHLNAGEDIIFSIVFAHFAQKAVYVRNFAGYLYRQNDQSIMHDVQHESFIQKIDSITTVVSCVQQFLANVGLLDNYKDEMDGFKNYLISDNVWAIKNQYIHINEELGQKLQQQIQDMQRYTTDLQQQIQDMQRYTTDLQQQIQDIENSKAYKLGRAIVSPYVKIKNLLSHAPR